MEAKVHELLDDGMSNLRFDSRTGTVAAQHGGRMLALSFGDCQRTSGHAVADGGVVAGGSVFLPPGEHLSDHAHGISRRFYRKHRVGWVHAALSRRPMGSGHHRLCREPDDSAAQVAWAVLSHYHDEDEVAARPTAASASWQNHPDDRAVGYAGCFHAGHPGGVGKIGTHRDRNPGSRPVRLRFGSGSHHPGFRQL